MGYRPDQLEDLRRLSSSQLLPARVCGVEAYGSVCSNGNSGHFFRIAHGPFYSLRGVEVDFNSIENGREKVVLLLDSYPHPLNGHRVPIENIGTQILV